MTEDRRATAGTILFAVIGALAACSPAPGAPAAAGGPPAGGAARQDPVAVRTAPVVTARAPRVVRATGTLRAEDEVTVAAEAAGRVVAAFAEVGDAVRTGQVLARVDDLEARLERAERERALAESLAKLGLASLPEGDPDFSALPAVERVRLQAGNARAKFDRAKALHDRTPPLISDQDFEDARTAAAVAESEERVVLLAARTQLAEARTRAAQVAVAQRRIDAAVHAAPIGRTPEGATDGAGTRFVVAERRVTVGDYVRVGDPLYRLLDTDPLKLVAQVPERRADGVVPGRRASVSVAGAAAPVEGRVVRIRPEVDAKSRTVEAEILVANPDGRLLAGAFATIDVDVGEDAAVPVVPDASIRTFAGVRKVFLIADGRAVEKVIATGRRIGAGWEVLSGLKAGDAVVLEPPAALVAGTPVRVEETPGAPR